MKKTMYATLFCCALASSPLAALAPAAGRGQQELIASGHWIYDALTAISLEAKTLNFADSAPLTLQRLNKIMAEIDYDALSRPGKAQYDRIQAYFAEQTPGLESDLLSIRMEPTFTAAAFYKTNDDIDWVYDRYSRKGLLEVPAVIGVGDYVTMSATMALEQNQGAGLRDDTYSNIPLSGDDLDTNFPHTAYISSGKLLSENTGVHFMIHQGSQSLGRTATGSIIWSDYFTGATTAKLSFFSPNIQYAAAVTEVNVNKYFYSHQLDVRLFRRFTLSFLEGLAVYAPLELRFLNPWMIFHGFAPWRDYGDYDGNLDYDSDDETHTCNYFGISFQALPVENLRLYGLFAMTQYQTPYERENWPNDKTPNGLGFQGGSELYLPLKKGYLHLLLEGSYADPYLYIKSSPNWSLVRTYSENMGDHAVFYEWIGSPFGPDTVSATLTAGYEEPGAFSLNLSYLFMARGEQSGSRVFSGLGWGGQVTKFESGQADSWCYPTDTNGQNHLKTSPSGIPEYVNRLALRGSWQARPWLTMTVQPAYVLIFNKDNQRGTREQGFEIALALEFAPLKF